MSRVRSDDSFWRVGAARYSPPEKLRKPGMDGSNRPNAQAAFEELHVLLAQAAGLRPQQVIVYCPVNAPGYQQAEHWVSGQGAPTNRADGLGTEIAQGRLF